LHTTDSLVFDGSAEGLGNFRFLFTTGFGASDTLVGGAGLNELSLSSNYSGLALDGTRLDHIQTVRFVGHSVIGVTVSNDVTEGGALTLDATALDRSIDR